MKRIATTIEDQLTISTSLNVEKVEKVTDIRKL